MTKQEKISFDRISTEFPEIRAALFAWHRDPEVRGKRDVPCSFLDDVCGFEPGGAANLIAFNSDAFGSFGRLLPSWGRSDGPSVESLPSEGSDRPDESVFCLNDTGLSVFVAPRAETPEARPRRESREKARDRVVWRGTVAASAELVSGEFWRTRGEHGDHYLPSDEYDRDQAVGAYRGWSVGTELVEGHFLRWTSADGRHDRWIGFATELERSSYLDSVVESGLTQGTDEGRFARTLPVV